MGKAINTKKLYILRYVIRSYNQVLYTICTGRFAKQNKMLVCKEFKPNGKGKFHLMGGMVKNRKQARVEKTALKWLAANKKGEMELENPEVYGLADYNNLLL